MACAGGGLGGGICIGLLSGVQCSCLCVCVFVCGHNGTFVLFYAFVGAKHTCTHIQADTYW